MRTFRELDERAGLPKGSAFRAFKRLEPGLHQGRDYCLLRAGSGDEAKIEALRGENRVYRNSINIVLVDDALAERLLKHLSGTLEQGQ
ncbi:hypothetical protein D0B54_11015 [Solimonas sp. K1W22B-7]|uniref:hypothetical protein n=1 Tax=Solimonas sp. K1W22B-7 TaxID=2303331 RepID=UPI000E32D605|nr:hypothetical protein [Solimonas sp. K1W22B-7]AXQ29185.1 hypothetical protein D0B54_11015 [Solimonas sp. K1W22B-7]